MTKNIYTRCSLGKGRWFWVLYRREAWFEGAEPFATGYAPTAEDETYALDRAELEAKGSVWSRSAREIFYTTPNEQRRQQWVSPDLALLELKESASKEEIKAAYRRLA